MVANSSWESARFGASFLRCLFLFIARSHSVSSYFCFLYPWWNEPLWGAGRSRCTPPHGPVIHAFCLFSPSACLQNLPRSIPYFCTRYEKIRLVVPNRLAALLWLPLVCCRAETIICLSKSAIVILRRSSSAPNFLVFISLPLHYPGEIREIPVSRWRSRHSPLS